MPLLWLAPPVVTLGLVVACFMVGGAHPVVQFNDDATRWWWSLWVRVWPWLLLPSAVAIPGVLYLIGSKRVTGTEAVLLTAVNFFTLICGLGYAPRA